MKEIIYKIGTPGDFSESEIQDFLTLLIEQEKVTDPTIKKVNRCFLLCICKVNDKIVAIGAVKPKTASDFSREKASLEKLSAAFDKELGYFFTSPAYAGNGFSKTIASLLLDSIKENNVMASTELRSNNPMLKILERNGFKLYGKPWQSRVHQGTLGLFLKYS